MSRSRKRAGRSAPTTKAPATTASRSETTPAPTRVARRRAWSIGATWMFILVFILGPLLLGQVLFVIPLVGFSVATIATMRLARSPRGPDAETLAPGALKAATTTAPVEVHGIWSTRGQGRGSGSAAKGMLRFANKRLSFVTVAGETTFEAPVNKVRTITVPGFWRPQLDLDIDGSTHSVRFFPLWDLGATVVGPMVAGEWYAQMRALGAR